MLPPASILPWIQTIGLAIAAVSLVVTMWNTFATRQAAEAATIFDLWSRYERYCEALDKVADEAFEVARRPFLDLANFIEHLCYLINRHAVPGVVRRNLESLVLDYLAITNRRSGTSYEAVLEVFRLSKETYVETFKFIRSRRAALNQREEIASEVVYGPFKSKKADQPQDANPETNLDGPSINLPLKAAEPLAQSTFEKE